jgi:hypothetical protein
MTAQHVDDTTTAPRASDVSTDPAEAPYAGHRAIPDLGRRAAPLLAVCGLCGGAGASTLSYLVARFALARGHVLLCDTGGPTGGLAAYAGIESAHSLLEAAELLNLGLPLPGGLYAVDAGASTREHELRVIAAGPRLASAGHPAALEALLAAARDDAHALIVVDCGTLQRGADRLALRLATHVAWVLPATASGVRRGERVLARICTAPGVRELVVARHDRHAERAGLRALRTLATQRRAPLVLVPELPDLLAHRRRALERAQAALQAIDGVLRR